MIIVRSIMSYDFFCHPGVSGRFWDKNSLSFSGVCISSLYRNVLSLTAEFTLRVKWSVFLVQLLRPLQDLPSISIYPPPASQMPMQPFPATTHYSTIIWSQTQQFELAVCSGAVLLKCFVLLQPYWFSYHMDGFISSVVSSLRCIRGQWHGSSLKYVTGMDFDSPPIRCHLLKCQTLVGRWGSRF